MRRRAPSRLHRAWSSQAQDQGGLGKCARIDPAYVTYQLAAALRMP
ncbi:hypothetical protein [Chondromyces apiculatus]|uniref:Uncharacterized protein n=1 Tax=Chondromyces apiculatus DSM 436 TaxID=1192034 RepID=A0A017TEG4_9BACT|nr:hypothetical protein [Chondromyces apiculatus]EYF06986.1 Hypothetical protein CAP_1245 [Chondromyces apiculatus DSM 436]